MFLLKPMSEISVVALNKGHFNGWKIQVWFISGFLEIWIFIVWWFVSTVFAIILSLTNENFSLMSQIALGLNMFNSVKLYFESLLWLIFTKECGVL